MCGVAHEIFRKKRMLNAHITKEERSQINGLCFHLMDL